MAQMLLAGYTTGKTNIKRAMRPKAASLASGAGGNTNVRIRSYAPRMVRTCRRYYECEVIRTLISKLHLNRQIFKCDNFSEVSCG